MTGEQIEQLTPNPQPQRQRHSDPQEPEQDDDGQLASLKDDGG